MEDGRRAKPFNLQERQGVLDALGYGLTLLDGAPRAVDKHLFRCPECHGTFSRSFQVVVRLKQVSCKTAGCPRSSGKATGAHVTARAAAEGTIENKNASLARLGCPLQVERNAVGKRAIHGFRCTLCSGLFDRGFQNVEQRHQWACRTAGCSNYDARGGGPSKRTGQKCEEALAEYGAKLLEPYRGAKHKHRVMCRCGQQEIFVRLDDVMYHKQKAYCSECSLAEDGKYGDKHYAFNPNRPARMRERTIAGREQGFHAKVKKDGNYLCILCLSGGDLEAHHLDGLGPEPGLPYTHDVERGVCLHRSCHRVGPDSFHVRYGKFDTVAEDFAKFYRERTGRSFDDIYDLQARKWRRPALAALLVAGTREMPLEHTKTGVRRPRRSRAGERSMVRGFENKQAFLKRVGSPLTLVSEPEVGGENHVFRCDPCGAEVTRKWHHVAYMRLTGCKTKTCVNFRKKRDKVSQSKPLEEKLRILEEIAPPAKLVGNRDSVLEDHEWECLYCGGRFLRKFDGAVRGNRFSCNTVGCSNVRDSRGQKSRSLPETVPCELANVA